MNLTQVEKIALRSIINLPGSTTPRGDSHVDTPNWQTSRPEQSFTPALAQLHAAVSIIEACRLAVP